MAEIIPFPLIRRRPHISLAWDAAWDSFRIEVRGRPEAPWMLGFFADHRAALTHLVLIGERLSLPIIDLTNGEAA